MTIKYVKITKGDSVYHIKVGPKAGLVWTGLTIEGKQYSMCQRIKYVRKLISTTNTGKCIILQNNKHIQTHTHYKILYDKHKLH